MMALVRLFLGSILFLEPHEAQIDSGLESAVFKLSLRLSFSYGTRRPESCSTRNRINSMNVFITELNIKMTH